MGRSTPRRRRVKQPSSRFAHKRNGRNEKFRYVNRFGTHAFSAFIGILFTGYLLILRPPVHVTVSPGAVTAAGGVLVGTVLKLLRMRRHRS